MATQGLRLYRQYIYRGRKKKIGRAAVISGRKSILLAIIKAHKRRRDGGQPDLLRQRLVIDSE